jgi:hypothetical protein
MTKKQSVPAKKAKSTLKLPGLSRLKPWHYILFVVFFAALCTYFITRSSAAANQLYLAPASTTVEAGGTFNVSVRLDPGTTVDGVTATLNYDPALLQYVAVDATGSAFTVALPTSTTENSVTVSRGIFAPETVSTDGLVATVSFKALAATSSTALQLSGNTSWNGAYLNPAAIGGSVIITSPPPPPPVGDTTAPTVSISSPANNTSGTAFTVKATAADNTGVVRMEVLADNSVLTTVQASSVTYKWNVKSKRIAKGPHTITVRAYDAAGNVGTSSVTVNKP